MQVPEGVPQGAVVGLAVALGAGLLIGIERERRKGEGPDRSAAGLRSFAVAALAGALAQLAAVEGLVITGAVLVAALAAAAFWKSRSDDPGVTTELALFATYLIGVHAVRSPGLGAACAAGLAALLAARERLHRFATQVLSEQEVHDGLMLTALALIVLPLIPDGPITALGGIAARPVAALVLLIMAIQAAGQMALRWLGPRGGVLAMGFVSGFVSSTATVASFGSRARAEPGLAVVLASGATFSAVATWLQAVILCAAISPAAAAALLPVALAGAAVAALSGWWPVRSLPAGLDGPVTELPAPRSALRPRVALVVALTLAAVAWLVGTAQRHFGATGLMLGVGLAALVEAHAPVVSLASLQAGGTVSIDTVLRGTLLAISANSLSRCLVAAVAGGAAYAARLACGLLLSLAVAWVVGWLRTV